MDVLHPPSQLYRMVALITDYWGQTWHDKTPHAAYSGLQACQLPTNVNTLITAHQLITSKSGQIPVASLWEANKIQNDSRVIRCQAISWINAELGNAG